MGKNKNKRASLEGSERAIIDLLWNGASTEQWAEWLKTPLLHAAAVGDLNLVIKLEKAGANGSALHTALECGQAALVRDLVERGASVTEADESGDSPPLHLAAALGDKETVSFLLEKGALPNALDGADRAPLHVAAGKGRLAAVNVLLAIGADTSFRYGDDDNSALDLAAAKGHVEVVAALIRSGVDVNAADSTGSTALHEAASHNMVGVMVELVDVGRAVVEAEDAKGWTALHSAADQGSSEAVVALLVYNADCNKPALGDHGRTPLHLAAERGSVDSVNALLAVGADCSLRGGTQLTSALEAAVVAGHVDVVRSFIEHGGVDVNDVNPTGRTALHAAAARNDVATIEVLVENGAFVDAHGRGWTPLQEASSGGCSEALVALMRHGANKSKLDVLGRSPLHLTAGNGHVDATNALLAAGANVNIRHPINRSTPIFLAASYGHVAVLRALIRNGARINERNSEGTKALHEAARHNEEDAIFELVEAGADLDVADPTCGWTPLHYAANGCCVEAVIIILENGARVGARDDKGRSPLHLAAILGHVPVAKVLLAASAYVNAIDKGGSTALHSAAGRGYQDLLMVLLQAGADVRATDSTGCTAVHDAVMATADAGTVRLLLEAGAAVDARDESGRTPLHRCARRHDCFETMAVLLEYGANANARDQNGRFPLHLATSTSLLGAVAENDVDLLLRWGADETALNDDGRTPLEDVEGRSGVQDVWRLRYLLTRAPADRNWRRRGWLILYRAYPRRLRLIPPSTTSSAAASSVRAKIYYKKSVSTEAAEGDAKILRGGAAVVGGIVRGRGSAPASDDWGGVVTWVVRMKLEVIFREVLMYL